MASGFHPCSLAHDDFWGWGPNRDGKNMLGRLWMEIRAELRAAGQPEPRP